MDKELLGWIGVVLSFASYAPYLLAMKQQKIRPHAFSWILWAVLCSVGFFAQYVSGAGAGSWVTAITAFFCWGIGIWSLFTGEKNITQSDWIALSLGLASIPIWYVTQDPFWAVVIITGVNVAAYYPTFRKSWIKPHEEQILMFFLSGTRFLLSYLALETLSPTTALIPLSTFLMDFGIVAMLIFRRKQEALANG